MNRFFKILTVALFIGLISGLFSALFLKALASVTLVRVNHHFLIWGLPFFGFIFGLILKRLPPHLNQGVPYIVGELENEKAPISPGLAPLVFLGSLGTHLFGGSAGREGVGVIMGAGLSQLLPQWSSIYKDYRVYLLYAGIAAGFASIFGTPLAAIIFAFELQSFKYLKNVSLLFCTVMASFLAYIISSFIGPEHAHYAVEFIPNTEIIFYLLIATLTSALGGYIFYWGMKGYSQVVYKILPRVELRLFWGGLLVSFFVFFTNSYSYIGIGTDMIAASFVGPMMLGDFFLKCLLTVMTISLGFKGGEVTPLFFMGATFSNSIASLARLQNFALSSSLGMVGLFGAAAGAPLASAVMGGELFGWKVGVLCFISCYLARKLMGTRSIYRS